MPGVTTHSGSIEPGGPSRSACTIATRPLEAACDILRIDVVGEDSDQVYELLAGNRLTHFTKLGGITR